MHGKFCSIDSFTIMRDRASFYVRLTEILRCSRSTSRTIERSGVARKGGGYWSGVSILTIFPFRKPLWIPFFPRQAFDSTSQQSSSKIPMTSPWQNFTASIRSVFFNPTLRFSLLRIICVSTFVLICNVPMDDVTISTRLCIPQNLFPALDNIVSKYKLQRMIYSYCLCAFTLLHHVPR